MERLPYIDEHSTCVGATPERTWAALVAVGAAMRVPTRPLGWLMRVQPALASGDWSRGVEAGATRSFRALVIGSGAHRVVVRRLLRRIEGLACSA